LVVGECDVRSQFVTGLTATRPLGAARYSGQSLREHDYAACTARSALER
jgi:hypothetical protein